MKQCGDIVFSEPEPSRDLHVQTISSKPSLTAPTVQFVRKEEQKPRQETITVEAQDQNQPPPRILNRHQRRRQEALARQKDRTPGKAPSTRNPSSARPRPGSAPPDPRLLLLEMICKWTVEGINGNGTYLSFLTTFGNGAAIVVMDPTDELTAAEIVRNINAPVAPDGLIGLLMPIVQKDHFEMARSHNTARAEDLEKALNIAIQSINTNFAKLKEQIHDATIGSNAQPAAATSAGTAPAAGPGGDKQP